MTTERENINIVEGCRNGDRKAQELLYKNYYKAMATLCMRYTKNEQDAIEALNNGFLKVFKNISRYEPDKSALYTWIRTIVVNSCLDFLKIKERTVQHKELNEASEVHVTPDALNKMKATEVLYLVRLLPPATQAVFNMYVMDGYSHREIGTLLSISEGTSKWHLSEARKNLQKLIRLQEVSI